MKDNWPATMISLQILSYCLADWNFFSYIKSLLILDSYPPLNFRWSSNHRHVTHIVGSWMIVVNSDNQATVFLARNSPRFAIRLSRCFLLAGIWWVRDITNLPSLVFIPVRLLLRPFFRGWKNINQSTLTLFVASAYKFVCRQSEHHLMCLEYAC